MFITQGRLEEVVKNYIDTDIMPKASQMPSVEQFLLGVKMGVLKRSMPTVIKNYVEKPELKLLGVVTEDGINLGINLDIIYESAKEAMSKIGFMEYGGFRFDTNDIDKLYRLAGGTE